MDKKELYKIVSYLIMGDGGVYYSGKECRFVMNMLKANSDYIYFANEILQNITSTNVFDVNDKREGRKETICLMSKSHPLFTQMREQIYTEKYKGLSPHYLKMLDWQSLALLYMSDGGLYIDKANQKRELINDSYSISLFMKRLSYGDQFILKKQLEKMGMMWNIIRAGKYFYLRLRNKDINIFSENISPFIFKSFQYKIIPEFRM